MRYVCPKCKAKAASDRERCHKCREPLVPACPACDLPMLRASERYFACGQGHGKLVPARNIDRERARREDEESLRRWDKAMKELGK